MKRTTANTEVLELEELVPAEEPVVDELGPEEIFAYQLRAFPSIEFVRQLRFAKAIKRQWQFDFSIRKYMVAVEIEGLCVMARCPRCYPGQTVVTGGHASITGITKDMEKYNWAAMFGWSVIRFPQKDVKPRRAIDMTLRVLAQRGWRA